MSSTYNVHVMSLVRGKIRSYRVTSRPNLNSWGELETIVSTNRVTTPSHLSNKVRQAYLYFNAVSKAIDVPAGSGFKSAWNISQNSSNRGRLDRWFEDEYPVTYWLRQTSSILGSLFFNPMAGVEWTFRFSDYSSVVMIATVAQDASLVFKYKKGSATDKDGNTIPDAGDNVQGEYTFSSAASMRGFITQLRLYGIKVSVRRSGGRPYKVIITDIKRN